MAVVGDAKNTDMLCGKQPLHSNLNAMIPMGEKTVFRVHKK